MSCHKYENVLSMVFFLPLYYIQAQCVESITSTQFFFHLSCGSLQLLPSYQEDLRAFLTNYLLAQLSCMAKAWDIVLQP